MSTDPLPLPRTANPLSIAVVGAGINGIMTAWPLVQAGHRVEVFDRGTAMDATSAASTKLLHGGLRYLENGEFRLVREGLRERSWWIGQAPHLAHALRIVLPVYRWSRRSRYTVRIGLWLYDLLAGDRALGRSAWHGREELLAIQPDLRSDDLVGGFTFWDGQMDDQALGRWAVDRARADGLVLHERTAVTRVAADGRLWTADGDRRFDRVINVAGPWARRLLDDSGIASRHQLDLVRGSHLVIDRPCAAGVLAEVRGERRIAFVLPYQGRTLVGTTEVRQGPDERPACSAEERGYLLAFHNRVMRHPAALSEVCHTFAGLRPLLRSADDPNRATREYAIERAGAVTTVFGGKWTTARPLGVQLAGRALEDAA